MSLRTRQQRSIGEMRMARIFTQYICHLVRIQQNGTDGFGYPLTQPNEQFVSFDHFCAQQIPGISIERYVQRICTYMRCSSQAYIFALAYIRRLVYAGFPLHAKSIHRVVLTAIVIAAKTRDDHNYSMRFYAQMGGVTNVDLNTMQLRFLSDLIDFRAQVSPQEYKAVMQSIAATTAINAAVALHHAQQRQALTSKLQQSFTCQSSSSTSLTSSCEVAATAAATVLASATDRQCVQLHQHRHVQMAQLVRKESSPIASRSNQQVEMTYKTTAVETPNINALVFSRRNADNGNVNITMYSTTPMSENSYMAKVTEARQVTTVTIGDSEGSKSMHEQLISSGEFDVSNCGMSGNSSPIDDFQQVHHPFSSEDTPSWTIACDVYWGR